jgi:hypothetical protein
LGITCEVCAFNGFQWDATTGTCFDACPDNVAVQYCITDDAHCSDPCDDVICGDGVCSDGMCWCGPDESGFDCSQQVWDVLVDATTGTLEYVVDAVSGNTINDPFDFEFHFLDGADYALDIKSADSFGFCAFDVAGTKTHLLEGPATADVSATVECGLVRSRCGTLRG